MQANSLKRTLGWAVLALALPMVLAGCSKKTDESVVAQPGKPVANKPDSGSTANDLKVPTGNADEVASAKAVVEKLKQVKNLNDLAELLTNKSAGMMGSSLLMSANMMIGMADMAEKQPNPNMPPEQKKMIDQMKVAKPALTALQSKYKATDLQNKEWMSKNGRALFKDVADALKPVTVISEQMQNSIQKDEMDVSKGTFTKADASKVKVSFPGKNGAKPEEFDIIMEEGAWRIDIPDAAMGGPGGPGGGPGGPGGGPGGPGGPR